MLVTHGFAWGALTIKVVSHDVSIAKITAPEEGLEPSALRSLLDVPSIKVSRANQLCHPGIANSFRLILIYKLFQFSKIPDVQRNEIFMLFALAQP